MDKSNRQASSNDELSPHKNLKLHFAFATLIPTVFFFAAVYFGLSTIHNQYEMTKNEIEGTNTIRIIFKSVTDLQKARGLSQIADQNNNPEIRTQLQNIQNNLIRDFSDPAWDSICIKFSIEKETLFVKTELGEIITNNTGHLFDRYTELIEKMHTIMLIVAHKASLILDPDLETYYLMELVVKDIPYLDEAVGRLRGLGSGVIAGKQITLKNMEKIKAVRYVLEDHIEHFEHANNIIKQTSASIYEITAPVITLHQSDMNSFIAAIDTFNQPDKSPITPEQFFQYGTKVIDNYIHLHNLNINLLIERLENRLTKNLNQMIITFIAFWVSVIAIFFFAFRFYRQELESIQKLEKMTITDPLTLIPNRRYMDIIFHRELQRARREKRGFAFGILDIDYFKQYNDTYGHKKGDKALQKVAHALMNSLQRGSDYYFRFGGEEFCFLIYPSQFEEAKTTAESICSAISDLGIEHKSSLSSPTITVTLGLIFIDKVENESMDFILKQADDLLYKGKDQGRNQSVCALIKE